MGQPSAARPCRSPTALVPALVIVAQLWALAGRASAQAPVAPAPPPPLAEGVTGQAPIAAGNVAAARERALNEAYRQLVEAAFAGLLAENALATPSAPLAALRASWLARPKRLVRNYRVL